jgi:hypothetical protein
VTRHFLRPEPVRPGRVLRLDSSWEEAIGDACPCCGCECWANLGLEHAQELRRRVRTHRSDSGCPLCGCESAEEYLAEIWDPFVKRVKDRCAQMERDAARSAALTVLDRVLSPE